MPLLLCRRLLNLNRLFLIVPTSQGMSVFLPLPQNSKVMSQAGILSFGTRGMFLSGWAGHCFRVLVVDCFHPLSFFMTTDGRCRCALRHFAPPRGNNERRSMPVRRLTPDSSAAPRVRDYAGSAQQPCSAASRPLRKITASAVINVPTRVSAGR